MVLAQPVDFHICCAVTRHGRLSKGLRKFWKVLRNTAERYCKNFDVFIVKFCYTALRVNENGTPQGLTDLRQPT